MNPPLKIRIYQNRKILAFNYSLSIKEVIEGIPFCVIILYKILRQKN